MSRRVRVKVTIFDPIADGDHTELSFCIDKPFTELEKAVSNCIDKPFTELEKAVSKVLSLPSVDGVIVHTSEPAEYRFRFESPEEES